MDYKTPVNVLIIDDDGINNYILEKLIKKINALVNFTVCLNGENALNYLLNLIRKDKAYPDFIFVDISMPIMNGWTFLDEYIHYDLDKILKSKIIIATSSIFKNDYNKALTYTVAKDFIIKPFSLDILKHIFNGIPKMS